MSVYHRQIIVIIFLADKPSRILAECPHFILKRSRISDQLRLIQYLVDFFHNLITHFDTHADIYRAGFMRDVILCTKRLQPVRTAPSCCHYNMRRFIPLLFRASFSGQADSLTDILFHNQILTAAPKKHIHALFPQIILNRAIDLLCFFCSHMADRTVYQL